MIQLQHWMPRGAVFAAFVSFGATAYGATWAGGRATPSLREVVAIDATGELNWPYGAEDVAGDGALTFTPAEQAIDVRTAYAATDQQTFWVRVYVSSAAAPGTNLHGFVFIDSDRNAATGGAAVAPEINAKFTSDPSPGGYEHVLELGDNRAPLQLWNWQGTQYMAVARPAPRIAGEAGTDTDPIRLGGLTHGYIQASTDLLAVDLTEPCAANLYVRTVNDTPALGAGDLDVGKVDGCVAADANGNGVPDVIVPPGCTSDKECPGGGICQAGKCILAAACVTAADCGPGMQCTPDGRCVPVPSGTCTTNADCKGLVCLGRQCAACTPGSNQCTAGQVCAPDGHCIANVGPGGGVTGAGGASLVLAADESVKGGACHCALSTRSGPTGAPALYGAAVALLVARRRRRVAAE